MQAIANVPGTTRSFGAGLTHRKNSLGIGLHAVLLQVNALTRSAKRAGQACSGARPTSRMLQMPG